jgi:CPA2 family monovalent cation:H+ antiporter-2
MPHNISLITTIAAALGFGLLFGMLAVRLKLPALVGYLAAGVIIGPATPGFVADTALASQLAEIGVMLLMFGVGLHFSLDDLMEVQGIALPGAVLQIAVATAARHGPGHLWGWSLGGGLVFGLALSVASTVVLLRALEDRGILDSFNGRIAVGWLVVEDLVTVLVLVLLPALAGRWAAMTVDGARRPARPATSTCGWHAAKTLLPGRRLHRLHAGGRPQAVPVVPVAVAKTGSRELFTLAVIAAAVGIAYGFVAPVRRVVRAGRLLCRHGAARVRTEPPRRRGIAAAARRVLGAVLRLGRHAVRSARAGRQPLKCWRGGHRPVRQIARGLPAGAGAALSANTAITVSASLAQIGEFSFILAALGMSLKLLPVEGQNLILAGAIISIASIR